MFLDLKVKIYAVHHIIQSCSLGLESLVGGFWPPGLMFETTELEVR